MIWSVQNVFSAISVVFLHVFFFAVLWTQPLQPTFAFKHLLLGGNFHVFGILTRKCYPCFTLEGPHTWKKMKSLLLHIIIQFQIKDIAIIKGSDRRPTCISTLPFLVVGETQSPGENPHKHEENRPSCLAAIEPLCFLMKSFSSIRSSHSTHGSSRMTCLVVSGFKTIIRAQHGHCNGVLHIELIR